MLFQGVGFGMIPQLNTVYNENCLETMSSMSNGSIDLVVTSPPYDGLRSYDGTVGAFDFENTANHLYRVIKPGGVVVWIVGDQVREGDESGTSFTQALRFKEIGFKLFDTMIYEKDTRCGHGSGQSYYQTFEYMFILTKGKIKTSNLIKDVKNKYTAGRTKRGAREVDGTFKKPKYIEFGEYRKRNNIWYYPTGLYHSTREKVAFEHPAIMPDKLAADHIKSWSNEGDVVYDPFAGSGTTLKQALVLKRKYIGSEISPVYCKIIKSRLHTLELFS